MLINSYFRSAGEDDAACVAKLAGLYQRGPVGTKGDAVADRDPRDTINFNVRMKESLRTRLDEAAKAHGGSMNSEVVSRLEATFGSEDMLPQALDFAVGKQLSGLALLIVRAIREAGMRIDPRGALGNPYLYDQLVKAVTRCLEVPRPRGEPRPPKIVEDLRKAGLERLARQHENTGTNEANEILLAIAGHPEVSPQLEEAVSPIRARLGAETVQRIAEGMGVPSAAVS